MSKAYGISGVLALITLALSGCAGGSLWAEHATTEDIRAATDFQLCGGYKNYEVNPGIKTEILRRGLLDEQEWDALVKDGYDDGHIGTKKCSALAGSAFAKQASQDQIGNDHIEVWRFSGCEPSLLSLFGLTCGYNEYTFRNDVLVDIRCQQAVAERCHDGGMLSAQDTGHLAPSPAYSTVRVSAADDFAIDSAGADAEIGAATAGALPVARPSYPDSAWSLRQAQDIAQLVANRHSGWDAAAAPATGSTLDIKLMRMSYSIAKSGTLTCADVRVELQAGSSSSSADSGCASGYGNVIDPDFVKKTLTDPQTISVQRYMYALYFVAVNRAELNAVNRLLETAR